MYTLIAIVALIFVVYPSVSSADIVSILSSVFENKDVRAIKEIEPVTVKNAQTMALLQSIPSVDQSTTTRHSSSHNLVAVADDTALTNENAPIPDSSTADPYSSDRISLYTVRDGDTFEQIAKMYGVSVSTILWANDLKKGTNLKTDQVLVILPISGVKYVVKSGDTFSSIAKLYNSDKDEIANFNNMDVGSVLAVGNEVIIPDAEGTLTAAENKKQAEIDAKNAKKLSDAKAKNKSKNPKGTTSVDDSNVTHIDQTGYFKRPINGGVRTQGLHGHNGIDLASSYGAPILAAASGEVVVAKSGGWNGGYGNYIVIQHPNGMQTLYGHLSEVDVHTGEQVLQSQEIGKMGSTGESTGVHLHFEVRGGRNPF